MLCSGKAAEVGWHRQADESLDRNPCGPRGEERMFPPDVLKCESKGRGCGSDVDRGMTAGLCCVTLRFLAIRAIDTTELSILMERPWRRNAFSWQKEQSSLARIEFQVVR